MVGVSLIANHELQALYKKMEDLERELAEAQRTIACLKSELERLQKETPHDNS